MPKFVPAIPVTVPQRTEAVICRMVAIAVEMLVNIV